MGYDLHIVRTSDWTQSQLSPITKQQVDEVIASDPELEWSTTDHIDMKDETGEMTRYYMIYWRGAPYFWWYRDRIECSSPNEEQQLKLIKIARVLDAFVIGDDGERYQSKKNLFGKEKVILT